MPLTPAEQRELDQLNKELGPPPTASGLTPEEEEELRQLNAELGPPPTTGLTPAEQAELEQLNKELGPPTPRGPEPTQVEAFARGAAQGLTFGWADEAVGAAEALFTNKSYKQARDESRANFAAAKEAHPGTTLAGELTGSVATLLVPVLGTAKTATGISKAVGLGKAAAKAPGLARTTALAAGQGAAYGLGAGESSTVKGDIEDALTGAAWGAGAALGLGALGATYRAGKDFTKAVFHEAVDYVDNKVQNIAEGAAKILTNRNVNEAALNNAINDAKKMRLLSKKPTEWAQSMPESQVKALADLIKLTDDEIAEQAADLGLSLVQTKAYLAAKNAETKFHSFLAGNKPVSAGKGAKLLADAKKDGSLAAKYKAFRQQEAMLEHISDNVIDKYSSSMPWLRKAADFISDSQFVYQRIDDQWGTTLQPALNKMSRQQNRFNSELDNLYDRFGEDLRKLLRAPNLDQEKIFQALDKGKMAGLSLDERQVVNKAREMTDYMLKRYSQLGMPIKDIRRRANYKSYFPAKVVNQAEYIGRIMDKAKEVEATLGKSITAIDDVDFKKLSGTEEFKDLLQGLSLGQSKAETAQEFIAQLRGIRNVKNVSSRMNTEAQALFRREEAIPDFLREKDPMTAILGSAHNNFRHAYLREPMAEMAAQIPALRAVGDDTAADYLARHLQDIAGTRRTIKDLGGQLNLAWKLKMNRAIKDMPDGAAKRTIEVARDAPEIMDVMINNMYPNFLGLNPRATIRNMWQPYVLTAADLAGSDPRAAARALKYAMRGSMKATQDGLKAARHIKDKSLGLEAQLQKEGWLGPKFRGEARSQLMQDIEKSTKFGLPKRLLEKATDMTMYFYQKSDVINRYTTRSMAKQLTKDFVRGDKIAKEMVGRMGRGYQAKINMAKSHKEIADIITDQLLSTTQFNYNRVSLSEFGRTMGPIFAMFSKWPTSVAGDILSTLMRKDKTFASNVMKVGTKYMGPLAVAGMLDYLIFDTVQGGPKDPQLRKMVGSGGFKSWMPVSAASSVITGELGRPPAIDQGLKLLHATMSDKEGALTNWVNDAGYSFLPGMGITRFISEEIPAWILNEEPKRDLIKHLLED